MAIISGSCNYRFIDPKLGVSGGPAFMPPFGASQWVPAAVYPAKASVQNGGFIFNTVAGGTSAAAVSIGPTPNGLTDNTVTWVLAGAVAGPCQIDTTASQELGYQAIAKDFGPNQFGVGQFMYVGFSGTTVPGDFVTIDQYGSGAGPVATATAAAGRGLCGISMGSGAAGKFGWIMILGVHDSANFGNGASVVGQIAYMSATAGRVLTTVSGTNGVPGVVIKVTGDTQNRGTAYTVWAQAAGNP